jgi:hypothetical protein
MVAVATVLLTQGKCCNSVAVATKAGVLRADPSVAVATVRPIH